MNALIITILGSITVAVVTAVVTHVLTQRQRLNSERRAEKLNHYKVLMAAISDLVVNNKNAEAHQRFALAINTIGLVAPQAVVEALMEFHDGAKTPSFNKLLTRLVLEIRADIGVSPRGRQTTFQYHLVGAPPSGAPQQEQNN